MNVSTRSSCLSSVSDPFFQFIILRLEKGEKGTNLSAEYGVSTSNVVKGLSAWRIRAYPHWQTKLELSRQNQRTNFVMTSFCLLCGIRTENVEAVKKLSKRSVSLENKGPSALADKTKIVPTKSKDKFCHDKFLSPLLHPH